MPTLMTGESVADERLEANGEDSLYEIIDGHRVELPPMSILASRVTNKLNGALWAFAESHRLGEVGMETLVKLATPVDRNRRPDVIFISNQRLAQAPAQPGSATAWNVSPDLYVEVISPTDLAEEVQRKLVEYFQAGARLIWVVYPTLQSVNVYQPLAGGRADPLGGRRVRRRRRVAWVSSADRQPLSEVTRVQGCR